MLNNRFSSDSCFMVAKHGVISDETSGQSLLPLIPVVFFFCENRMKHMTEARWQNVELFLC
jgi:hypothetical protein